MDWESLEKARQLLDDPYAHLVAYQVTLRWEYTLE
jgi:hypothetical protein